MRQSSLPEDSMCGPPETEVGTGDTGHGRLSWGPRKEPALAKSEANTCVGVLVLFLLNAALSG